MTPIQTNPFLVDDCMTECENDVNLTAEAPETIEKRALNLVCKKRYSRDALIKELMLNPSDIKIRIRKELLKYRKLK